MEQLINFETSKLAKEAGFDYDLGYCYNDGGKLIKGSERNNYFTNQEEDIIAPSQSLLQKWLRDVHGIQIDIESTSYDGEIVSYSFTTWSPRFRAEKKDVNISYELCLEDALQEALKLVMSK